MLQQLRSDPASINIGVDASFLRRKVAKELGVSRRVLYQWRDQGKHGGGEARPRKPRDRERELRQQLEKTKRLLGEKTLEVDFFRGALQKIEARRQNSENTGGAASTTRSGS
jgi:transposase